MGSGYPLPSDREGGSVGRMDLYDRALWLLVPLWLVCFGLGLHSAITEVGYPTLNLERADAPGEPPAIVGFGPDADASGLALGDRVLAVNGVDLRGQGHTALYEIFYRAGLGDRRIVVDYERAGARATAELPWRSYRVYWPRLPGSFVFALAALLLSLRMPRSRAVRAFAQTFLVAACFLACTFGGGPNVTRFSFLVHVASVGAVIPLALRAALLFPGGARKPGRFARWAPWLFLALIPFESSRFYEFPFGRSLGNSGMVVGDLLFFGLMVGIASHTFRMADALGRRQMKWVLLGLYLAVALPVATTAFAATNLSALALVVVSMSTLALIPISVVIAIARTNLFDIDRLINATASYTLIGLVAWVGILAAVPPVADRVSQAAGLDASNVHLALSLVIAAAILPAHRWLAPRFETVFYPARQALSHDLDALGQRLRACESPGSTAEIVGEELDRLMRPESGAIYVRDARSFSPIWVRGHVVPPAFAVESPLVSVLERRGVPLSAEGLAQGRGSVEMSPFDRAALETLGVPVIVPVRVRERLAAVLCLGSKRSGDVYTSSELGLLGRLGERLSAELSRFGQDALARDARDMQEALRRYVPGALVDELAQGRELEQGRREVSILFVDIRGYSRFAEDRSADEIFSTVNRYTRSVSEVVGKHGGSVVEFNGDGMMAVFGAPRTLPAKEAAATRAGREIVRTVSELPVDEGTLEVGVGIATGEAFVGSIQAADRAIWSAVGNTTNLAARLQEMTRELSASIVIDAETHASADEAASGFEPHEAVVIRGRRESEDVYVLRTA